MAKFRKVSRVGSLLGATRWYLSDDCLLSAKGNYTVEYRRFYLRDLESIVIWPNRLWLLRPIIPGVVLGGIGVLLWHWVNFTAGAIFGIPALLWVALELALGPTAESRIRTSGAIVDLPLVKRTRRARRVLAKIDAAVRADRGSEIEQSPAHAIEPQPAQAAPEMAPAATAAPTGDIS